MWTSKPHTMVFDSEREEKFMIERKTEEKGIQLRFRPSLCATGGTNIPWGDIMIDGVSSSVSEDCLRVEFEKLLLGQDTCFGVEEIEICPGEAIVTFSNFALNKISNIITDFENRYGNFFAEGGSRNPWAGDYEQCVNILYGTHDFALVYLTTAPEFSLEISVEDDDDRMDHYLLELRDEMRLSVYEASTAEERSGPDFQPFAKERQTELLEFGWLEDIKGITCAEKRFMSVNAMDA